MTSTDGKAKDSVWHGVNDARPWTMPRLEPGADAEGPARPPTAAQIEAWHEAARVEGYAEGHAQGLQAAASELASERERLALLAAQLAQPLAELDVEVERALANLALSLARRIVGREIRTDTEALQTLVNQVISHLGSLDSVVEVRLHPEDCARLRSLPDIDTLWRLQADDTLNAGDVVVRHGDTHIDARLTERVSRLAAEMLDGF